jgi:hypothetical protein
MSIAFLAAFALLAAREDWVRVTEIPNGNVIYVDGDAIERGGDTITIWERRDYGAVAGSEYREMRVQSIYDCSATTVQVTNAVVVMRTDGKPQNMSWTPEESPPEPAKPRTVSDTLLQHACNAAR